MRRHLEARVNTDPFHPLLHTFHGDLNSPNPTALAFFVTRSRSLPATFSRSSPGRRTGSVPIGHPESVVLLRAPHSLHRGEAWRPKRKSHFGCTRQSFFLVMTQWANKYLTHCWHTDLMHKCVHFIAGFDCCNCLFYHKEALLAHISLTYGCLVRPQPCRVGCRLAPLEHSRVKWPRRRSSIKFLWSSCSRWLRSLWKWKTSNWGNRGSWSHSLPCGLLNLSVLSNSDILWLSHLSDGTPISLIVLFRFYWSRKHKLGQKKRITTAVTVRAMRVWTRDETRLLFFVPVQLRPFTLKAWKLRAISCVLTHRFQVLLSPPCVNYIASSDRCHVWRAISVFLSLTSSFLSFMSARKSGDARFNCQNSLALHTGHHFHTLHAR